ncbi:MAG: glycoside hydrolase family 38 C-terminal domain-containing protein, partial [Planctomycetota bacterium]
KACYVPDPFGHIAQLPQLARGFDLDCIIFWRGVGDEGERLGTEFLWVAPDGTRMLTLWQRKSYANLRCLGLPFSWAAIADNLRTHPALAARQVEEETAKLLPLSHVAVAALWNGVDHHEAHKDLPRLLAFAAKKLPQWTIRHSHPGLLAAEVRRRARRLPTFSGEFTRSRYDIILSGVYSARMYLKQLNHAAETELVRYAEPLAALSRMLIGGTDHRGFLRRAWRTLLKNHPHDDICGCSGDEVHRDMLERFREVSRIASIVSDESARDVANAVDASAAEGIPLLAFNPVLSRRAEVACARVWIGRGDLGKPNSPCVLDGRGRPIPSVVRARRAAKKFGSGKLLDGLELDILFRAELPAFGTTLYSLGDGSAPEGTDLRVTARGAANGHLAFAIRPDGRIDLVHRATGRRFRGLHVFEDTEDAGDEYDYSPLRNSLTITSRGKNARVRLLRASPLETTWRIARRLRVPESLTEDRGNRSRRTVALDIRTDVTLFSEASILRFETTVTNTARDHRLRVLFGAGLSCETHRVREHFDVFTRSNGIPDGKGWEQKPIPTRHQKDFVDLADGRSGLCLLNEGLPEYEVQGVAKKGLALTLLRCVGWLSRDDLLTRNGHAGPGLPTPDAQCPGTHVFRYALYPHAAKVDEAQLAAVAAAYLAPIRVRRAKDGRSTVEHGADSPRMEQTAIRLLPRTGPVPASASFLQESSGELLLAACKESERGGSIIVRFVNLAASRVRSTLRLGFPVRRAYRVLLSERRLKRLPMREGSIRLVAGAGEIVTVELVAGRLPTR